MAFYALRDIKEGDELSFEKGRTHCAERGLSDMTSRPRRLLKERGAVASSKGQGRREKGGNGAEPAFVAVDPDVAAAQSKRGEARARARERPERPDHRPAGRADW